MPASFGYLSLAGYLFGIRGLYSFGPFDTVALNTGIACALAALAILFTAPDAGWRGFFAERPISLDLLKRMLPLALSLPLFLEAIVIWGGRIGMYKPLFGAALVVLAAAASSATLTWVSVRNVRAAEGLSAKTTKALAASERRFRGIFEHAATGIAIGDIQGRLQSYNPALTGMLGYSEDELRDRTFLDLVHPEDRDRDMTGMRRLIGQEIPHSRS